MRRKSIINLVGWYGAIAILVAYGLSSSGALNPSHPLFQLLNLTGALGLLTVAMKHRTHQLVLINAAWAIIAAASLMYIWVMQ